MINAAKATLAEESGRREIVGGCPKLLGIKDLEKQGRMAVEGEGVKKNGGGERVLAQ